MSNHPIIYPTNFPHHSRAAFKFASALASHLRTKLLIVHVTSPAAAIAPATIGISGAGTIPLATSMEPVRQSSLLEQLNRIKPSDKLVVCDHMLLQGDPATEIVDLAKQVNASQIVMGSHGREGLTRVLLGSVAESVLRKAPCPVTVVKVGQLEEQSEQE